MVFPREFFAASELSLVSRHLFPQLYKRSPLLAFADRRTISDIFVARVHKRMFDLRNRLKGEVV